MLPSSTHTYSLPVRKHLSSFWTRSNPKRTSPLRRYSSEPSNTQPPNKYKSGKKNSSASGTFLKSILALTVVGGGTYGASAYYALQNPEFREIFVHRVYAGDVVVKQLEKWRDEQTLQKTKEAAIKYKNDALNFGRNAYRSASDLSTQVSTTTHDMYEKGKAVTAEITKKTGEMYEKGKSITSDVNKKTHDLYEKSTDVGNAAVEKSHRIFDKTQELINGNSTPKENRNVHKNQAAKEVATEAKGKAVEVTKMVGEVKEEAKSAAEDLKHKAADNKLVQEVSKVGHDAKETVSKVGHDAKETVSKVGHDAKETVSKAGHDAKQAVSKVGHDAKEAVLAGTSGIAALLSFSTSSPEPVIAQLSNTLHELDAILGQLPGEKAQKEAHRFLTAAASEVSDLNSRIAKIKDESKTILEKTVAEQSKKLDAALQQFEQRSREELSKRESHLREDFAIEKAELTLRSSEELKRQLAAQTAKFNVKLHEELTRQATTLERRWLREARLHVDRERGGRLARLDKLESRLVALERLTTTNTSALQQSAQVHQLRSAVQSLRDVLNESTRRPFKTELAAVKSIGQNDSVIVPITETIPARIPETGVDTLPDLVARFTVVAEEVRKVALVSPDSPGGFIPHILSALFSNLMFRKHGLPEGDDVESILARTEFYLREEELDSATRELNQLKGWPKTIARDWLKAARDHLEFKQAVDLIELQSNLLSLRMG